jgi:hypothetical protein
MVSIASRGLQDLLSDLSDRFRVEGGRRLLQFSKSSQVNEYEIFGDNYHQTHYNTRDLPIFIILLFINSVEFDRSFPLELQGTKGVREHTLMLPLGRVVHDYCIKRQAEMGEMDITQRNSVRSKPVSNCLIQG